MKFLSKSFKNSYKHKYFLVLISVFIIVFLFLILDLNTVFTATDATPPTTPTNLIATAISSSQIDLIWSASTDNVAVVGYRIYRGGIQIAITTTTTYSDTGLTASTTYNYTVSAYDAAGNESGKSSPASAITLALPILQASDLQYLGVFAPPLISGSGYARYQRGMTRCKYVPSNLCKFGANSDPSPDDGFPGCLICNSHPYTDLIGAFDIKPPIYVDAKNRTATFWSNNLPHGQQVLQFMDCTGGILKQYGGGVTGGSWDIASALILPNGDGLCQFYDWYNVASNDNPSAVWFTPNPTSPNVQGPYNWGPMDDIVFNANKNAANLGLIPKIFSDKYLNGNGHQYCYAGYNRGGSGGDQSSPGPTLYAFDCESRPTILPPGPITAVTPLLYYQARSPLAYDNEPLMPRHTPRDTCYDSVWINYGGKKGVLWSCLKGGPYWWYGQSNPDTDPAAHRNQCLWNGGTPVWGSFVYGKIPGSDCSAEFFSWGPSLIGKVDVYNYSKGYHAIFDPPPYMRAELVFYNEDALIEVVQGTRQPTNVSRSVVLNNPSELWDIDGTANYWYGGLAFDETNGLIYLTQIGGVKDNPVIHVYQINSSGPQALSPDITSPAAPSGLSVK